MGELQAVERGKSIKYRIEKSLEKLSKLRDNKDFSTYHLDIPSSLGDLAKSVIKFNNKVVESIFTSYIKNQEKVEDVDSYGVGTYENNNYIIEAKTKPCQSSLEQCFYACANLLKVDSLDMTGVKSIKNLFTNCKNLLNIENLNQWGFDSVVNADYAFRGLKKYDKDIAFETPVKISSGYGMFQESVIKSVDLKTIDISQCDTFTDMLRDANLGEVLDFSNWDFNKLKSASWASGVSMSVQFMCYNNVAKKIIAPRSVNVPYVLGNIFQGCGSVKEIDNLDHLLNGNEKITELDFKLCSNLVKVGESQGANWDTSKLTSIKFDGCTSLETLVTSNWDTSNMTSLLDAFKKCYKIKNIDVSNWNTSKVLDFRSAFQETNGGVLIKRLDFSSAKYISYAFYQRWSNDKLIDLEGDTTFTLNAPNSSSMEWAWRFTPITDMTVNIASNSTLYRAFREATRLQKVTFQNKIATSVMTECFISCYKLTSVNFENLVLSGCASFTNAFNSAGFTEISADWEFAPNPNMSSAFAKMSALTRINLPNVVLDGLCTTMLSSTPKLTSVTFKSVDLAYHHANRPSKTTVGIFSNNTSITHIDCTFSNIMESIDIAVSKCPLDRESALNIINGLYDYSEELGEDDEGYEIQFSQTTCNNLLDEDYEIAFLKRWNISGV